MELSLLSTQGFVQSVAEALAAVLKIEVEIVDSELLRVAGTGRLRSEVGVKQKRGFVNSFVLKTGEIFLVSDPGNHLLCSACDLKGSCFYMSGIFCPITVDGKSIGLISLVSFTQEQTEILLNNYENIKSFILKMAELLATKMKEEGHIQRLKITSNNLKAIVDSIQEGIIAIDKQGAITDYNVAASGILRLSRNEVMGRQVQDVFPSLLGSKILKVHEQILERVVTYQSGQKRLQLISSAFPITVNNEFHGAVESFRLVSDVQRVASRIGFTNYKTSFDEILGNSVLISQVKEKAYKVAVGESTVLIDGESGTGKELFARAIHSESSRSKKPFVAINCCAIPDNLLESELFGYDEGAFTGAKHGGKAGKFELANGGSVFLDEIGEMPLYLQAKLLRVLQERQIDRVGGVRSIDLDIRIIAATNKNLGKMVTEGEFREDLYYRLHVIPITIPPLRDRKEDIPCILEHFLSKFNRLMNKSFEGFTPEALDLLMHYPWQGNVRELQNIVEYTCNLETNNRITIESLPLRVRQYKNNLTENICSFGAKLSEKLRDVELTTLMEALQCCGTSVEGKEKIAEILGLSRATLYRKLKEHNLL